MTLPGHRMKASVLRDEGGHWITRVTAPSGASATTASTSADEAWSKVEMLFLELTEQHTPVRGDAWIGPRGREMGGVG